MTFGEVVSRSWNENRLLSAMLELTYRCNLDCVFCYNDLSLRGRPLAFEQYATLLRDLASMNVMSLTLSGGEPLTHPDFFRIGALARELGFVVRIKTNGHALRGDLALRLRDEVDPYIVETSLHGATPDTHDRQTRVPGSFLRLLENIRNAIALGLRVKVNSTLTRWNEYETAAMYAICDDLGVPLEFDLQVSPRDDGDRSPLQLAASAEGIRSLLAVQRERHPEDAATAGAPASDHAAGQPHCGAGTGGISVDPFGNIYPCVAWRKPVASLHDQRIGEIWATSFQGIREENQSAAMVVGSHALGRLLNFCPGLAESMTGSPTAVPAEMERVAKIVAEQLGGNKGADAEEGLLLRARHPNGL